MNNSPCGDFSHGSLGGIPVRRPQASLRTSLIPLATSDIEITKTLENIQRHCWLALLQDFRAIDWASEYTYPNVMLDQMKGLLAKYENV